MTNPIVVGALGGSGTRVVAQILIQLGVNLGNQLNSSNDELLFTHLFKRPQYIHAVSDKNLVLRLKSYAKLRVKGELHRKQYAAYLREALQPIHDMNQEAIAKLIEGYTQNPAKTGLWGWKEPNSHVILPALVAAFPEMKYIHVIRHGYAMATSSNRQQLDNWGEHYGIRKHFIDEEPIMAQFKYWRVANRGAQLYGEAKLKDRFMLLRIEDLVNEPGKVIRELADFVGVPLNATLLEETTALVSKPDDFNRYEEVKPEEVGDDGTSLPLFGYENPEGLVVDAKEGEEG